MKKVLGILLLLALLLPPGVSTSQALVLQNPAYSVREQVASGGMPPRSIPTQPVPHHQPGEPSRASQYTTDVVQVDEQGAVQTATLTGLDALLADETIKDPLAGNPTFVEMDNILYTAFESNAFDIRTFGYISDSVPSLQTFFDGQLSPGTYSNKATAAGDLNGDGIAEQINSRVIDPTDEGSPNLVEINISELPSLPGKATSMPAALSWSSGRARLFVRGLDSALYYNTYDPDIASWVGWASAGGTLTSGPAAVSLGPNVFDVFAIGTDNLTYQRHWAGSVVPSGDWQLVDNPADWPEISQVSSTPGLDGSPGPELDAPAAISRAGGQIDLFRRGPDNTLRWNYFNGSYWEGWQSLGGILTSAPSAVAINQNSMQVFWRGVDNQLWSVIITNGSITKWEHFAISDDITIASAPFVSKQPGETYVFVRGSDDALWRLEYSMDRWTSLGGELGSGAVAAVLNDQFDLFAQKLDGTLQHGTLPYSADIVITWLDFPFLVPSGDSVFDPGEVDEPNDNTILPGYENGLLDIATGYFTGDGRAQVVIAYSLTGYRIKLQLYDIRDGFTPFLIAESAEIPGSYPKITSGDWDGDGLDEIGLVYLPDVHSYIVSIFGVDLSQWTGTPVPITLLQSSPRLIASRGPSYQPNSFAGTLRIASGDLDGDSEAPAGDPPVYKDEFVILSDWYWYGAYLDNWFQLYIMDNYQDVPPESCNVVGVVNKWCTLAVDRYNFYNKSDFSFASGAALDVGNVSPEQPDIPPRDEIVITCPPAYGYPSGETFPFLSRNLLVLDASSTPIEEIAYSKLGISGYTYLDTLSIGDLNRDLVDEIALYANDNLKVYDLEQSGIVEKASLALGNPIPNNGALRSVELATGAFTGESLRVGRPSYRLQRSTGDLIVVLNEPPKHMDTLDGVTTDVNSTDNGTYAAYETETEETTSMSIQVRRDWDFAAGMEMNVGDPEGTHVKTSLDATYGADFSNSTTIVNSVTFGSSMKTTTDDIVLYTGKDIQVWEYPVYDDDSRQPAGRILVTFPLPGPDRSGTQKYTVPGNTTCDFWYAPEHQVNNLWSYAETVDQLRDFDPELGMLNPLETLTLGALEKDNLTSWSSLAKSEQTSSVSMGVSSAFELQIGGDTFEVSAEPFGIGAAYEVHLPYVMGTLTNSYSAEALSTHTVSGSDQTSIRVVVAPIDPKYSYNITPYLYWAKGGYLVLDYLTAPGNTTFWNRYNKTDPAFILPWKDLDCPGARSLFSKDIVISPYYASNDETVTITATVHNFSNLDYYAVPVRFYQGLPSQNVQISEDQVIDYLPPRGRVDVSVDWIANGRGEQRIYAVIDPDGVVPEMHDETSNPENNNNTAFGIVAMGDTGFVDPGGSVYFDYQFLTYTDTAGLESNIFLPTAAMSETIRIEMQPLAVTGFIAKGLSLVTYKGGDQDPWSMTFQPMPAAIWLRYTDEEIAGLDEGSLVLYRYDKSTQSWVDAACGTVQRYPEDNSLLVPICQTGDFALLKNTANFYLPVIRR